MSQASPIDEEASAENPLYDRSMSPFERALRREHARELLAQLTPGGSRSRPIEVSSASVIEPRAMALPCPHCGGEHRIHEHVRIDGLRLVDVTCRRCSAPRALWFRIVSEEPN